MGPYGSPSRLIGRGRALALAGLLALACVGPNPLYNRAKVEGDGGQDDGTARGGGGAGPGSGGTGGGGLGGGGTGGVRPADGGPDAPPTVNVDGAPTPPVDARLMPGVDAPVSVDAPPGVDMRITVVPDAPPDVAAVVPPSCLPWWNTAYRYRRRVSLDAGTSPAPAGTWASYTFDHRAMVAAGTSKSDGSDLRILYWDGAIWVELEYFLDETSRWGAADTTIWFSVGAPLAGGEMSQRYFIYYGNAAATAPLPASETLILRRVQTGSVRSTADGVVQVPISALRNTARAFLLFQTRHAGTKPVDSLVRGVISSPTLVEFHRRTTTAPVPPVDIRWYVVEFVSGVRVQRGELTQSSSPIDITINQVLPQRAFTLWSRTPVATDVSWTSADGVVVDLSGATSLQMRWDGAAASQKVAWQVIELINEGWVQRLPPAALAGIELMTSVTLSRATNLASSVVITSALGPAAGADIGARMVRAGLADNKTVTLARETTGDADDLTEVAWQAIEFPSTVRAQSGLAAFATGEAQVRSTLITAVDPNRAVALASGLTGGGESAGSTKLNTGGGLGACTATLTVSASQVVADRGLTSSSCNVSWFVLEFPRTLRALDYGGVETSPGLCRDM